MDGLFTSTYHVNRKEERERKERHDDQVNKPDSNRRRRDSRLERSQVYLQRRNAGINRGGGTRHGRTGVRSVGHELAAPLGAKAGAEPRGQGLELRYDVVVVGGLLAGGEEDDLHGARGVVGPIAQESSLPEQRRRVRVYDHGRVAVPVVDGLAHGHRVEVVECGRHHGIAEGRLRDRVDGLLRELRHGRSYERRYVVVGGYLSVEVDEVDSEVSQLLLDDEEVRPVEREHRHDGAYEEGH